MHNCTYDGPELQSHFIGKIDNTNVNLSAAKWALDSDLRNFERTLIASMVSLFSLYKTKWQKLPRFLGQKCFLGALMDTEKKWILLRRTRIVELNDSHFQKYKSLTDSSHSITDVILLHGCLWKKTQQLCLFIFLAKVILIYVLDPCAAINKSNIITQQKGFSNDI